MHNPNSPLTTSIATLTVVGCFVASILLVVAFGFVVVARPCSNANWVPISYGVVTQEEASQEGPTKSNNGQISSSQEEPSSQNHSTYQPVGRKLQQGQSRSISQFEVVGLQTIPSEELNNDDSFTVLAQSDFGAKYDFSFEATEDYRIPSKTEPEYYEGERMSIQFNHEIYRDQIVPGNAWITRSVPPSSPGGFDGQTYISECIWRERRNAPGTLDFYLNSSGIAKPVFTCQIDSQNTLRIAFNDDQGVKNTRVLLRLDSKPPIVNVGSSDTYSIPPTYAKGLDLPTSWSPY